MSDVSDRSPSSTDVPTIAQSAATVPLPTQPHPEAPHQSFWLWVMCLTGVDYFSTLGYQPSTAFDNAGMLAPLATIVLVLVTLLGALPVYAYVCARSHTGQGSIGMLASLMSGWYGKIIVLTLLGFAATDFVITKTLSAADAAEHLISNPFWPKALGEQQMAVTMGLLVLLGAMFMRGFKEVIGLAVGIVAIYLVLNVIVVGAGLVYLGEHPEKFTTWVTRVETGEWFLEKEHRALSGSTWLTIIAMSFLVFPKLALGLSGFETGVAVMPLIKGDPGDKPANPVGRIRNTRKLLATAAFIMSAFLLGSSLVVSTLIEPSALVKVDAAGEEISTDKPPAADRALAYIAHGQAGPISPLFGETFGTIYDLVTAVILWFAGASAMAGLLNLVPQYLPRYGMAPEWAKAFRPLVLLFTGINLLVTWIFGASVKAQSDAYATGVLVLMTSAGVACVIDVWRHSEGRWWQRFSLKYGLITLAFVYTTAALIVEKPVGMKIALCFIATILVTSFASRIVRSRELRFTAFNIPDPMSKFYWDTIRSMEMSILVPHRPGRRTLAEKEAIIRVEHRIPAELMVVFVEVELQDASEFINEPWLDVRQEEGRYVMKINHAASIAHTLAALGIEMAKVGKPPEIHFGWTDETPWTGTLGFLLFGEGNVPWMVRELIRRAEPDPAKRPLIVLAGS